LARLNTLKTRSSEVRAEGSIANKVNHTPKVHQRLKSLEDFRLETLRMRGIFHRGRIKAAMRPRD